jgi:hypothetical protein
MEKSAAKEACFPSFPTIPTPTKIVSTCVALYHFVKHTHISGLNHADIVTTISYRARSFPSILFN